MNIICNGKRKNKQENHFYWSMVKIGSRNQIPMTASHLNSHKGIFYSSYTMNKHQTIMCKQKKCKRNEYVCRRYMLRVEYTYFFFIYKYKRKRI